MIKHPGQKPRDTSVKRFRKKKPRRVSNKAKASAFVLLVLGTLIALFFWETRHSKLQAWFFSKEAAKFTWRTEKGASNNIRFPAFGPSDVRLGYVRIPEWTAMLSKKGYVVEQQARWSPELIKITDMGLFPIYREKDQAGICIRDRQDEEILCAMLPKRTYPDFEAIPPILVTMLTFIENRQILEHPSPYYNPAVEWKRLAQAIMGKVLSPFTGERSISGGSTLATQLEKYRHSPKGYTDSAKEKLRQMLSASFRAYLSGELTGKTRRRIICDYINSIPLAAIPGYGEVNGLGDGLWAWYGMDFDTVNRLLRHSDERSISEDERASVGEAIKACLSLFLALRRPSAYLVTHKENLGELTDSYLRVLSAQGAITPEMRDAALKAGLSFRQRAPFSYPLDMVEQKSANMLRSRLMADMGADRLYDLDRVDMSVATTLDMEAQKKVTDILMKLKDPAFLEKNGLKRSNALQRGDPAEVVYSFSLYEHVDEGNVLRVQTNSYGGPFNIDEQTKLDLGSSAKLRVLVHYLDVIEKLHKKCRGLPASELKKHANDPNLDPLGSWVAKTVLALPTIAPEAVLERALERKYSASSGERFFTGGGMHSFANYRKADSNRVMSVRDAFAGSVNLVFVRMMRDIVYHYIHERYGITPAKIDQLDSSERKRLLTFFADREGTAYIRQFYSRHNSKNPEESRKLILQGIFPTPVRVSVINRYLAPEEPFEAFADSVKKQLPASRLEESYLRSLYEKYGPDKFPLSDIGYLAHVHPLELWLARYLGTNSAATLSQVIEQSVEQRQEVYQWLFKTKSRRKQNSRIRNIMELEAFAEIHREWKRLGYPFDYLSPSYASALGSSGDRPDALADLVGIILNDGVFYRRVRFQAIHFAKGTPFETRLVKSPSSGTPVIDPEVAKAALSALVKVVEQGTAASLANASLLADGTRIAIGGKTGTGDHRYKTFGSSGALISSRVVNRAATFVFFLGKRHFGVVTAFVPGAEAASYEFTSSLPVAILKMIIPEIQGLL